FDPIMGESYPLPAPLNEYYQPFGWMGDLTAIQLDPEKDGCEDRAVASPAGDCYKLKIDSSAARPGWTGIFWQTAQDNWGDVPACDFSAEAPTVTFWAKGAEGGEVVSFFASDIPMGTLPPTALTDEWTEYTIDLSDSTNLLNM